VAAGPGASVARMATTIDGISGLSAAVGDHLGYSEWREISQEQVGLFADATGDHQWIHVDVERATAGPFGAPIAHGFLTLSLAPVLLGEILTVTGISMGVNYGLNKVRFPAPVPVGSKLRAGAVLTSVDEIAGGAQVTLTATWEVDGGTKPVCVAELVFRYYA
jgi:acyl dehydratase